MSHKQLYATSTVVPIIALYFCAEYVRLSNVCVIDAYRLIPPEKLCIAVSIGIKLPASEFCLAHP